MGFPGGALVKNPPANAGDTRDMGSIPGSGRSPGIGNGNHSSILAWKIPQTEEPGGLLSTGSQSGMTERAHTYSYIYMSSLINHAWKTAHNIYLYKHTHSHTFGEIFNALLHIKDSEYLWWIHFDIWKN